MEIIFSGHRAAAAPKQIAAKKDPQPRKKRSDAKHDIKYKLSLLDKQIFKFRAIDHKLSATAFGSMVVKNDLIRDIEYDVFDYEDDGVFLHVTLEHDYFEMVKTLSVEWDLPYRKVVHRIIKNYLHRSSGEYKIINYIKNLEG